MGGNIPLPYCNVSAYVATVARVGFGPGIGFGIFKNLSDRKTVPIPTGPVSPVGPVGPVRPVGPV